MVDIGTTISGVVRESRVEELRSDLEGMDGELKVKEDVRSSFCRVKYTEVTNDIQAIFRP